MKLFVMLLIFAFVPSLVADENSQILSKKLQYRLPEGKADIQLHYLKSDTAFVNEVVLALDLDLPKLVTYFEWAPLSPIHIVVDEKALSMNGYAMAFPHNQIGLNPIPPEGDEYLVADKNWIRGLVIHEVAHVLHMEQTRGFSRGLRATFGSVGKMGMVVPAWFAEGVATFVESNFGNGGRLHASLLEWEVKHSLADYDFCETLSCLDNPGSYLGGHARYWIGGHFLNWLEKKKAGTVSCLVRENSNNIPFLLNGEFEECLPKNATSLYRGFLSELIVGQKSSISSAKPLPIFGVKEKIILSKGLVSLGEKLYAIESKKRENLLVEYDLKTFEKKSYSLKLPVDQISKGANSILIRTLFPNDMNKGAVEKSVWYRFLPSTGKIEKMDFDGSYFFESRSLGNAAISWKKDHYELSLNQKWVYSFSSLTSIGKLNFFDEGDHLIMVGIFNGAVERWTLSALEGLKKEGEFSSLYESGEPILIESSRILFKDESSKVTMRIFDLNTKKTNVELLSSDVSSMAALFDLNETNYLLFDLKEFRSAMILPKSELSKIGTDKSFILEKEILEVATAINKEEKNSSYNSFSHLTPSFWLPSVLLGTRLQHVGLSTFVSDPRELNTLTLSYKYLTRVERHAYDVEYQRDLEPFVAVAGSTEAYQAYLSTQKLKKEQANYFALTRPFYISKWKVTPIVVLQQNNVKDVNNVVAKEVLISVQGEAKYHAITRDEFVQSYIFKTELTSHQDSEVGHFNSLFLKSHFKISLTRSFDLKLRGSYEKLFKDSRESTILEAGSNEVKHPFYGTGSLYLDGNEVVVAAMEGEQLFGEIYHGYKLWPFYSKELSVIGGASLARVQHFRSHSYDDPIKNRLLASVHTGLRYTFDLFYLMPLSLDYIFAHLLSPAQDEVLVQMTSEF